MIYDDIYKKKKPFVGNPVKHWNSKWPSKFLLTFDYIHTLNLKQSVWGAWNVFVVKMLFNPNPSIYFEHFKIKTIP